MGLVLAWLAGEGLVTYRWIKAGAPPTPGTLLATSGFFALLALLHEIPAARTTATLLAVGIDVAALLQVLPGTTAVQATGWPPLPIADPTVLLPAGGTGGQTAAEGQGAAASSSPSNPAGIVGKA